MASSTPIANFFVSQTPVVDSTRVITHTPYSIGEKLSFKYNITSATGEWLYIFCNDELALRYKLNIKRNTAKNDLTDFLNQ